MTLEQEIRLAAKHAAQEAYEKSYKKAAEEKLESARKLKAKNIPDDIIAECVGFSLEEVKAL